MQINFSAADEIRKFKELLDIGAITEAEFNEKKSALLSGAMPAVHQEIPAAPAPQPIAPPAVQQAFPAAPAKFCPRCGLKQEHGGNFCPRCGYKVK